MRQNLLQFRDLFVQQILAALAKKAGLSGFQRQTEGLVGSDRTDDECIVEKRRPLLFTQDGASCDGHGWDDIVVRVRVRAFAIVAGSLFRPDMLPGYVFLDAAGSRHTEVCDQVFAHPDTGAAKQGIWHSVICGSPVQIVSSPAKLVHFVPILPVGPVLNPRVVVPVTLPVRFNRCFEGVIVCVHVHVLHDVAMLAAA